ncbi:hypothetical protein HYQ45_015847 [Verticillium longisporum]|uniref:CFEM domain-containing protein n=1 Tax=Verticillium longisporum TaxID=100787 RepID=A0A8I2Z8J1_VERLO|nr:hypothetical protein HYQ44_019668 [Verticillium longisporum]KAG7117458.1 hypothetical protein HYQ45_015847 [Verticillium longisporum]
MKNTYALMALAASLGEVSATWKHAKPFSCPDNTNNDCFSDKQKGGFDWQDTIPGRISNYNNFDFKGWTCESKPGRTNDRSIKGKCGSDKFDAPNFGSGDKFSIGYFDVSVEFDCDLEFHYDMPDGGLCKHRAPCSKQGTTVKNSQCGGAKNVTVVYPPQPNKPKTKCGVDIWKIGFDCDKPKPPTPPKYTNPPKTTLSTISVPSTTPVVSIPVSSAPVVSVPVSVPGYSVPVESAPASSAPVVSVPVPSVPASVPVVSIPASSAPVESVPGYSVPVESAHASSAPVVSVPVPSAPASSAPVVSVPVSVPVESAPVSSAPVESAPGYSVPAESVPAVTTSAAIPEQSIPVVPEEPITQVTSYQTVSTIFTTKIKTVTDCGPEKPECGGAETPVVVTVTIPQTTTVCDVTETIITTPTPTAVKPEQPETPEYPEQPEVTVSSAVAVPSGTAPETPIETLPCPDVVPKCLNTWIFSVGCQDNTDTACYCPDVAFVENIFSCIYAYGGSDDVISEATKFFQGVCAGHVKENPAIVTDAERINTVITVVPTATSGAHYTTITLDATTVVPCVTDGTTIEGSSTTTVIKSTIEVPKVDFTTPAGATDVVPIAPTVVPIVETPGAPAEPTLVVAPSAPAGTGGVIPTPAPSGQVPVEAGAGKVSAGVGAVMAIMALMVAM